MINRIVLVGRLTKDPELRQATSGRAITSFTLAVDGRGKKADGTKDTSFIPCVAFGQTAENMSKFTRKGSLVGVDGTLNQRKYQKQDGTNASVLEVLCDSVRFLESKGKNDEVPPYDDAPIASSEPVVDEPHDSESLDLPDDDLPF